MPTRLMFKHGPLELECEGEEKFVRDIYANFKDIILSQAEKLSFDNAQDSEQDTPPPNNQATFSNTTPTSNHEAAPHPMTVRSIAKKLGYSKGPQLAYCAVASLSLFKNVELFSRKEILDEMQSATGLYTANMGSNLTKYINKMLDEKTIIETSKGTFATQAQALEKMSDELADS